jgi:hypothetical protein
MLSLTGPGDISDFLGGSNLEFESEKRGVPPFGFGRCLLGALDTLGAARLELATKRVDDRRLGKLQLQA